MKNVASILIIGLLCVLSCGCTSPAMKYKTAAQVAKDSTIEHDSYRNTTWVKTPYISGYPFGFLFRASKSGYGYSNYQLYLNYIYTDWAFFDRAYDSEGRKLRFTTIDHEVSNGGIITETFAINFDRAYLERAARGDGLNIKLVGKRRTIVYTWRPIWIEGFLMKIDNPDKDYAAVYEDEKLRAQETDNN